MFSLFLILYFFFFAVPIPWKPSIPQVFCCQFYISMILRTFMGGRWLKYTWKIIPLAFEPERVVKIGENRRNLRNFRRLQKTENTVNCSIIFTTAAANPHAACAGCAWAPGNVQSTLSSLSSAATIIAIIIHFGARRVRGRGQKNNDGGQRGHERMGAWRRRLISHTLKSLLFRPGRTAA